MDKDSRRELLLYLVIWLTVFAVIPLAMLIRKWTGVSPAFDGRQLLTSCVRILPFLVLFILHDRLAAPLLLKRKKTGAYLILTVVLFGFFTAAIFMTRPGPDGMGPRHSPPPPDMAAWEAPPPRPDDRPGRPGPPDDRHNRPIDFEILCLVLGAMMLGANLGIKAYFLSKQDTRALRQLQSEQQSRQEEIERIRKDLAKTQLAAMPKEEALYFKKDRGTVRVGIDKIAYAESMSEYIRLWIDDREEPLVVLYRLRNLASELPADRFLQIHRSYLINLSRIRGISHGNVTLDNGKTLPIGDSYRPALKEYLSNKS